MPTTLIFGASRGLGRAFTHHALSQGHRVVALVRSPEMAMELSALGVEVIEGDALECLLRHGRAFDLVVFNEPHRARLPHVLGGLMHPLVNRVTRHDLHTSLRAGFRRGEISGMMKSAGNGWDFRETSTWRGAVRVLGWRV